MTSIQSKLSYNLSTKDNKNILYTIIITILFQNEYQTKHVIKVYNYTDCINCQSY